MSSRTMIRFVSAVAVCGGALAGGCVGGAADESGAGEPGSREALLVDEAKGTLGGLRLGDSPAQVRRSVGPTGCLEGIPGYPLGVNDIEIGGRDAGDYLPRDRDGPFTQCVMRYQRLAVTVFLPDGTISFVTTDPQARTRRGVGIGDSADLVKQRYPGAMCEGFQDTGDVDSVPGGCLLRPAESSDGVAPPRLSFGLDKDGEEVRSIYLEAPSWQSIKRLRRR